MQTKIFSIMALIALFITVTSCDKQEPAITPTPQSEVSDFGFEESQFTSEDLDAIKSHPGGLKGWIDDQNSHLYKAPDGRYFLSESEYQKFQRDQKGHDRAQDSYWLTFDSNDPWQTAFYKIYHQGSAGEYYVGIVHSTSFIVMGAPTTGTICSGYNLFRSLNTLKNNCAQGLILQYIKNSTLIDQDIYRWDKTQAWCLYNGSSTCTWWRMLDGGVPGTAEDAIKLGNCSGTTWTPYCGVL